MKFTIIAALLLTGCANFRTVQTDISYENGLPSREITTKASATTVIAGKSALSNFKASQTDKTQSANVGALTQESDSEKLVRAVIDQAIKSSIPVP